MKNNIKHLRLKVPISQRQFALAIGKLPTTYSNYENGVRGITVDNAWDIVKGLRDAGLKVSFEDVFPEPERKAA